MTRAGTQERRAELGPILTRVAALAGLGALFLALILVVFRSGATYELHAVFEDVRGLIPGGEVKAGAETVGTVEEINFNEAGLPVVTMSVDDDFRIRQGGFADIRLASNLGGVNRFVDLLQGDGPPLPDGSTLGQSQTDQPVDLDVALSDLDPETRDELASILANVDAAVKGRGSDIDKALRHSATALGETADVLAQVNGDRVALRTLVAQGRRIVGALATNPAALGETADNLAAVLEVTAARQLELRRATRALGPGLGSARLALERLEAAIPNLHQLVLAAGPAVGEIVPTAREIRGAIGALGPLLDEARVVIDAAPAQFRRLRRLIRAAEPVIERLDPILDVVGPMVDHLRAWAPEVAGFFTLWADASSNYDANGNLARLGFTPFQEQSHTNLVAPSDNGPGLVRRPFYRTPGSLEGDSWLDYGDSFIGGGEPVDDLYEGGP